MSRATVLVCGGELAHRRGRARRRLEDALERNIAEALRDEGVEGTLVREQGRMLVATADPGRAAARLRDVFGVSSCSPVVEGPADLEGIVAAGAELARGHIPPGSTFAVRARRSGELPFTSLDVARALGSAILAGRKDLAVDLGSPAVEVFVEARPGGSYLSLERGQAAGGLPLGTGGRCVSLLAGGMDPLVAAWLMMKRGCVPLLLHLDRSPHGGWGMDEALRACRPLVRFAAGVPLRFHSVPFGEVLSAIAAGAERRRLCVLCRRAAALAADLVAERARAELIVTGDILEGTPSRTAHNLAVEGRAAFRPVVRPLVGMDRSEVDRLAHRAGLAPAGSCGGCCGLDTSGQDERADESQARDDEELLDIRALVARAVASRRRRIL